MTIIRSNVPASQRRRVAGGGKALLKEEKELRICAIAAAERRRAVGSRRKGICLRTLPAEEIALPIY